MTSWEIPQAAFTAESVTNSTTTSSVFDHLRVVDTHDMEVEVSAFSGDSVVNVLMQGSLDGSNWYELVSGDWDSTATVLLSGNGSARYTRVIAGTNDGDTTATITVTVVSGLS
jgi:hypothetical protein